MLPEEYIKNVIKTESMNFEEIGDRVNQPSHLRLLHASLGMNTEQAEFADALKKYLFYGKEVDVINLVEELGDLLWYVAIAADELQYSLEEIMARNIAKLHKRYGISFNEEGAINRDLSAERYILEKDNTFEKEYLADVKSQNNAAYPRYILDKMRANGEISDVQYERMVVQIHEVKENDLERN